MKKSVALPLWFAVATLFAASGCHKSEPAAQTGTPGTQTIPASDLPSAQSPTGSDAMTQTVSVEDGRSEDEGGIITNPTSTAKTSTTSTAAGVAAGTGTTTAVPPKKIKKHK